MALKSLSLLVSARLFKSRDVQEHIELYQTLLERHFLGRKTYADKKGKNWTYEIVTIIIMCHASICQPWVMVGARCKTKGADYTPLTKAMERILANYFGIESHTEVMYPHFVIKRIEQYNAMNQQYREVFIIPSRHQMKNPAPFPRKDKERSYGRRTYHPRRG